VRGTVTGDDNVLSEAFGGILIFTEWGADGSVILRLSREVKEEVQEDFLNAACRSEAGA